MIRRWRPGQRTRVWLLGIIVLAAVAGLVATLHLHGTRRGLVRDDQPPIRDGTTAPPGRPAPTPVRTHPSETAQRADSRAEPRSPTPKSATDFDQLAPNEVESQRRALMGQALDNYRQYARYPPSSRPASEQVGEFEPRALKGSRRPLTQSGSRVIEQFQDVVYLAADESAVVAIRPAPDGGARPSRLEISDARLVAVREGTSERTKLNAPVKFNDRGLLPDPTANDGMWFAHLAPRSDELGDLRGDLFLETTVRQGNEEAEVSFHFVYTGAPPARFTGKVRDVLEDGSVAFYFGIDVFRAGHYILRGRVHDSRGKPVALLQFNDVLKTGSQEIRFVAFGRVLIDEKAVSRLVFQDVEGWRMLRGAYPDREVMHMWSGSYETAAYGRDLLSSDEWESPAKRRYMKGLERHLAGP